jgi:hypothetical protein
MASDCVCNSTRMMCVDCYTKLIERDYCVDCRTFYNVIKCDVCEKRLCKRCSMECREKGCKTSICHDCYRLTPQAIKPGKCMKHRTQDMYLKKMKELRIKLCERCKECAPNLECSHCDKFICRFCVTPCYSNEDGVKCSVIICDKCADAFPFCILCDE